MMCLRNIFFCVIVTFFISSNLLASAFLQSSNSSLVVFRLGDGQTSVSQLVNAPIFLDEYDISGATSVLVNTITIPPAGLSCVTLTSAGGNSDGHLHISTNKQFLTFMGYRITPASMVDPAAEAADYIARVVCRVDMAGNIDASTALVDDCNYGAIRGAVTDDGTRFWTTGDNASGANEGGLRFALLGATQSINLSHNQVPFSSSPTTDNPRDVGIFDGQLYVGSGSGSSIGKALLKTVIPLPTSGAQDYLPTYTEEAAASAFVFLDLDPNVPGVDTVYTASTNPTANAIRKYSKNSNGTWVAKGYRYLPGANQVTALKSNGKVIVFAGTDTNIFKFVDANGPSGSISGNIPTASPYIHAGDKIQFRGIEFLPIPGDINLDGAVNFKDFALLAGNWLTTSGMSWNNGDVNGDKKVKSDDLAIIADNWLEQVGI